jgi:hypothetical protein
MQFLIAHINPLLQIQLLEPLLTPKELGINEQFTFVLVVDVVMGAIVEEHCIPFQLKPFKHRQTPVPWLTPLLLTTKLQFG